LGAGTGKVGNNTGLPVSRVICKPAMCVFGLCPDYSVDILKNSITVPEKIMWLKSSYE